MDFLSRALAFELRSTGLGSREKIHSCLGKGVGIPHFLLTDTAILAQSRFILLESMMILFGLLALYSVIRFRRFHSEPFSANWWTWITAASFFMGAAFWLVS